MRMCFSFYRKVEAAKVRWALGACAVLRAPTRTPLARRPCVTPIPNEAADTEVCTRASNRACPPRPGPARRLCPARGAAAKPPPRSRGRSPRGRTAAGGRPALRCLQKLSLSEKIHIFENMRCRNQRAQMGGSGLFLGESGALPGCFPPAAPVLQGRPPRTELLPLSRASPRRTRSCRDAPRTRDPRGSGENRGPGTVRRCPWF